MKRDIKSNIQQGVYNNASNRNGKINVLHEESVLIVAIKQYHRSNEGVSYGKILLLIGELYIMYTFLYTNTLLLLLVLIVNTNVGWVVNEEVVVIEVTFEYYRSNDGGSSCKILLLP